MEFGEAASLGSPRREVGTTRGDRLANGDTAGFDPSPRLRVLPPVGGWFILDDALALGAEAEEVKQRYRAESGWKRQVKGKRKKPEDGLRLKDPW